MDVARLRALLAQANLPVVHVAEGPNEDDYPAIVTPDNLLVADCYTSVIANLIVAAVNGAGELLAMIERVGALLRELEWSGINYRLGTVTCAECDSEPRMCHAADCRFGALLAEMDEWLGGRG